MTDTSAGAKVRYADGREALIVRLEAMLAKAAEGEFTSVGVAAITTEGDIVGAFAYTGRGSTAGLLGSVVMLQHRIATEANDSVEEEEEKR